MRESSSIRGQDEVGSDNTLGEPALLINAQNPSLSGKGDLGDVRPELSLYFPLPMG